MITRRTCDEPSEDGKGAWLAVRRICDGGKDVWMFTPVGGKLCERDGGENERRGCERREVARKGGDAGARE